MDKQPPNCDSSLGRRDVPGVLCVHIQEDHSAQYLGKSEGGSWRTELTGSMT